MRLGRKPPIPGRDPRKCFGCGELTDDHPNESGCTEWHKGPGQAAPVDPKDVLRAAVAPQIAATRKMNLPVHYKNTVAELRRIKLGIPDTDDVDLHRGASLAQHMQARLARAHEMQREWSLREAAVSRAIRSAQDAVLLHAQFPVFTAEWRQKSYVNAVLSPLVEMKIRCTEMLDLLKQFCDGVREINFVLRVQIQAVQQYGVMSGTVYDTPSKLQ